MWRPGYDGEGWKLTSKELERRDAEENEEEDEPWKPNINPDGTRARFEGWLHEKEGWEDLDYPTPGGKLKAPDAVPPALRLKDDIEALRSLLASDAPATQDCRTREALVALYLIGDASGKGLGNAFWDEEGLDYEAGNWANRYKEESSNLREASNLASKFERKGCEGELNGREFSS